MTMNRLTLPFLALLAAFLLNPVMAGPVYKVVDEKTGKVIGYTDKPQEAAINKEQSVEPVKLPHLNTQPGIHKEKIETGSDTITTAEQTFTGYRTVSITSPSDQATITPGDQSINVSIQLSPELQPGHLVQFYLDNMPYGKPEASTTVQIGKPNRGEHTISATILDARGKKLAASATVTVYVKQASLLNRPPPANPPPKS